MRLRNKMIVCFTILLTVSFCLFLGIVYTNIKNTNWKLTESFSTQVIASKAQEAGSWLDQRLSELRVIALQDSLLEGEIDSMKPYINRLNTGIGRNFGNEWGTFAIGHTDGIGWVSDGITIDVSDRMYFQKAMKTDKEYILSSPVISKTDEAPICLICYPLKDQMGQTFGFLNGAISLKKLTELVGEIEFYDGISWIMDTEGAVYTSQDTYPDEQMLKDLQPFLTGRLHGDNPQVFYENQEQMVFFTEIPSTENWFLCTSVRKERLMKDTNRLQLMLAVVCLAVLAAALVLCMAVSDGITRPLRRLEQSMRLVKQGDLTVRSRVEGQDEITSLSLAFNQMLDQIELLMKRVVEEESEKRDAEFRLLQSQINPHFLYNSLDTLQWKAYDHEDDEMSRMIEALSSFFRISLSKGKEVIPLSKEIEHIKSYLYIQKIRFQDVLDYTIETELDPEKFQIVKLTLQPLIENAIQHGIKPRLCKSHIEIHIWKEQDCLILQVIDDGVGMDQNRLKQVTEEMEGQIPGEGYGLHNVNQRLKLVYGVEYGVTLASKEGEGTCATVKIPVVMNGQADA